MSEAMARAVGAKSPMVVKIGKKECRVKALSIRELMEVERDCVDQYKREYIKTYTDNIDLLPEKDRGRVVQTKFEEVARMDKEDLPLKFTYNSEHVSVTKQLRQYMTQQFNMDKGSTDKTFQLMTAAAMDQGILSEEKYKELTNGAKIVKIKVPYVSWWITGCTEGKIAFIWAALKQDGITKDQVWDAIADNISLITEVANEIERLSAPAVGNG